MSDTTKISNTPGDLAFLPPAFRNHVELCQKQLGEIYGVTRETIRTRALSGALPPKLPNRPKLRPKWSAMAINEHLRQQFEATLTALAAANSHAHHAK